jgi:hypothetical protein
MTWEFPPSIAAKCREIRDGPDSSSAGVKKCARLRRVMPPPTVSIRSLHRIGNNPEKIIPPVFAVLPQAAGLPLEGVCRG